MAGSGWLLAAGAGVGASPRMNAGTSKASLHHSRYALLEPFNGPDAPDRIHLLTC
jgi:hypothetical protein